MSLDVAADCRNVVVNKIVDTLALFTHPLRIRNLSMATASPNVEAAAHLNVPQHALEQSAGVTGRGSTRSRSFQFWVPVLLMTSLFGTAVLVHKAVAAKWQDQARS